MQKPKESEKKHNQKLVKLHISHGRKKNMESVKTAASKIVQFSKIHTSVLDKNDANNASLNLKITFNGWLR